MNSFGRHTIQTAKSCLLEDKWCIEKLYKFEGYYPDDYMYRNEDMTRIVGDSGLPILEFFQVVPNQATTRTNRIKLIVSAHMNCNYTNFHGVITCLMDEDYNVDLDVFMKHDSPRSIIMFPTYIMDSFIIISAVYLEKLNELMVKKEIYPQLSTKEDKYNNSVNLPTNKALIYLDDEIVVKSKD